MWVLELLNNADIIQLDVQVLVNALQCAADLDIVLKLDGDLMVDEGLEEAGLSMSVLGLFLMLPEQICGIFRSA